MAKRPEGNKKAVGRSVKDPLTVVNPGEIKELSGNNIARAAENGDFFHVGVGASAGGLEALEEFFRNMPVDSGMAFIVVQHLSPDYKSLMNELLSRYTSMNIHKVTDAMPIERDSIYLIPPKKNMTIFQGKLFLTDQHPHQGLNLPIDVFFRSLAEDKGKYAIGIILSGTGSDGALGIRSIKEAGGMVMVQDDKSAKFDGMPRSSIATGMVDYILPAAQMPGELVKYVKHPYINKSEKIEKLLLKDEDILTKIIMIVKDKVGVDFTYYKPNTILRRLEKRISINQIDKIENYVTFLSESPNEARILYKELLIGVTRFFRDTDAFNILKTKIIPALFDEKPLGLPTRVWCAGCSTGEEAYSIAILLREYMDEQKMDKDVKIFATDIDRDAIEYAGQGVYPESIIGDVSPERLTRFFTRVSNGYQVNERIRRMVIFAPHNITKDPPFSKIDMITCRNLLIYLNNAMQKKIISMFYFALNGSGHLFLGSSESLGDFSEAFEQVSSKWKIFKYKSGMKPPVAANYMLPPVNRRDKDIDSFNYHRREEVQVLDRVFDDLVNKYVPPSVIVNETFEIVHVLKDINQFIALPTGKMSLNIMKMVKPELAVVLGSMLNKVLMGKEEIIFQDIPLKDNGTSRSVNISTKLLRDHRKKDNFILITFEENDKKERPDEQLEKFDLKGQYNERLLDLEKELVFTKENLQATIEELETSNEELQSTNEELIASNEELQSTNEELQSVNEELYTVNTEYQSKIEELTQLNNDVNNLLKNTNIGTLYLDTRLRIRKFTPVICKIINVMEMDVGRPLHHLSLNTRYEDFFSDVEDTLNTLRNKEKEVVDQENNWYLLRILPYRTEENAVEGIVITLTDITSLKAYETLVQREQDLLKRILDVSPVGQVVLDQEGNFTYLNKKGEDILELTLEQLKSSRYNKLPFRILDMMGLPMTDDKLPYNLIMTSKKSLHHYMQVLEWEDGHRKVIEVNGAPIYDNKHEVVGGVFNMEDKTEQFRQEEQYRREHDLMIRVLDNSPVGKFMVDLNGIITYSNNRFERMIGMDGSEIKGKLYTRVLPGMTDTRKKPLNANELPLEHIRSSRESIYNKIVLVYPEQKGELALELSVAPVLDSQDQVSGAVFSVLYHC